MTKNFQTGTLDFLPTVFRNAALIIKFALNIIIFNYACIASFRNFKTRMKIYRPVHVIVKAKVQKIRKT